MDRLRINVFAGMANIPLFAGQHLGAFAAEGLALEILNTPSSLAQRAALVERTSDIAHAAFDDVVAGVEDAGTDFVAFLGGDGGFQALFARPEVERPADLRGRQVAVDDPETAYALVLRAVLRRSGVPEGEYGMRPIGATNKRYEALRTDPSIAASMLSPPFSVLAEDQGWRRLGSPQELLGAYQGTTAFSSRAWLSANRPLVQRYLRAYLKALEWSLDSRNTATVVRLVAERLQLEPRIAERSCAAAIGAPGGLVAGAVFDEEGMRQVLALRAEVRGQWGGKPPPYERYIDPMN